MLGNGRLRCLLLSLFAALGAAVPEHLDEAAFVQLQVNNGSKAWQQPLPSDEEMEMALQAVDGHVPELLPRRPTREEIAKAMAHIRGAHAMAFDPSDEVVKSKVNKDSHDWNWADWSLAQEIARRLCISHFAGGMSFERIKETYIAEWMRGDPPIEWSDAVAKAKSVKHWSDSWQKYVKVQIGHTRSDAWRYTGNHHGCYRWRHNWREDDVPTPVTPQATDPLYKKLGEDPHSLNDQAMRAFFKGVMADNYSAALVVLHGGNVYEEYCTSCGFNRNTRQPVYSVGKSAQGILLRKRVHEGALKMESYSSMTEFGKNASVWKVTNKNLVNMIAGAPPDEDYVRSVSGMVPDLPSFAATTHKRAYDVEPGTWYYSTGYSWVVGRELRYSFGNDDRAYSHYPWTGLFDAIGATSWLCEKDGRGTMAFGSHCWATTRDLARMGLLLLREGRGPAGEQVIPKDVAWDFLYGEGHGFAGFYVGGWYRMDRICWWNGIGSVLAAQGVGGQVIFVVPKFELVVARHSFTPDGEATVILDTTNLCRGEMLKLLYRLATGRTMG